MSTDIGAGRDCDEVVAGGGVADVEAEEVAGATESGDEAEDGNEADDGDVELTELVTAAPAVC